MSPARMLGRGVQRRGPVGGVQLAADLLFEDLQAYRVEGVVLVLGVLLSVLTQTRPMSATADRLPFIKTCCRSR
jgi:hypothetical protein